MTRWLRDQLLFTYVYGKKHQDNIFILNGIFLLLCLAAKLIRKAQMFTVLQILHVYKDYCLWCVT